MHLLAQAAVGSGRINSAALDWWRAKSDGGGRVSLEITREVQAKTPEGFEGPSQAI